MNKNKASLESLNALHAAVAKTLAENLDDPKVLANAIKFLKDNDITADIIESEEVSDLGKSIKNYLGNSDTKLTLSVTDMYALAD